MKREQAVVAILKAYPLASKNRAAWKARLKTAEARQSSAELALNAELKPAPAAPTGNDAEQRYKASAKTIPYALLIKDPAALKGRIVTYKAHIFQYDSNTTTRHFIASVTNVGFGVWDDNIWADVDPAITTHVCQNTIVQLWGGVVGPYTYITNTGGNITIPEISVRYIQVLSAGC